MFKARQPVPRPQPQPLHYDFFTTVAVAIWDAAMARRASNKGALFVVSHASLESGFAQAALRYGDYNLFGQMTRGNDSKRRTSAGKVKDFSQVGGYAASMAYYFNRLNEHQWSGLDLIQRENFTAQDIDDAFNTGTDYPTDKERHGGKYAYNNDMDRFGKNHYGDHLYQQMKTTKVRMVAALDYKIRANEAALQTASRPAASGSPAPSSQTSIIRSRAQVAQTPPKSFSTTLQQPGSQPPPSTASTALSGQERAALTQENTKFQSIVAAIRSVSL